MSSSFTKNKEKRPRSSPNEANNSFVKNVTSRMSGLLPAAVTKWFSSPSSANGSAPNADNTDSSTEDEPENLVQPPPKRMRYTSPTEYNHYTPDNNCSTTNTDTIDQCNSYSTVQSPPGRTTFRRETNFVSTPLPSENGSKSDKSRDSTLYKTQSHHSVSTLGPSVATKRKSLFDSPLNREAKQRACAKTICNTVRDPNEPCFKPSLLGSPFYPGRTMYGGASANYINRPNIKQRKNALVNESSNVDNSISHTARRVMDLLEHYSSPLNEAKRIPMYVRPTRDASTNLSTTSPDVTKIVSYKTQELHVPSIASILRLKQHSRLTDMTRVARQLIASHSSTSDYVPYPTHRGQQRDHTENSENKYTSKMKTKIATTRQRRSEEVVDSPISLPSAVLQVDSLPKFSFGISMASSPMVSNRASSMSNQQPGFTVTRTTTRVTETKTCTKITEVEQSKPQTITDRKLYKFASPERLSSEEQPTTAIPKFTFGSPERQVDKANVDTKKDEISCVVGTLKQPENKLTVNKTNDWKCSDCWVSNKEGDDKCVCCGASKPCTNKVQIARCAVCKLAETKANSDKCATCENIKFNNISKKSTDLWTCDGCWVKNDASVDKCVCCQASKQSVSKTPQNTSLTNHTDSTWTCDVCWIKNTSDVDKCVACSAAKPGAKGAVTLPSPASKPLDKALKLDAKTPDGTWVCTSCLVKNESNKTRCVCCESEKPGTYSEADKKLFNFGLNTSFNFGIDPKAQEATPKAVEVNVFKSKPKEESETNNNVLGKAPAFSFGMPIAKKSDTLSDATKKANEVNSPNEKVSEVEAPKVTFSFGIPKSLSTTSVTQDAPALTASATPFFGIHSSSTPIANTKDEEKDKPQEVPQVTFTLPKKTAPPALITHIFKSPSSSAKPAQNNEINTHIFNASPLEKKETTLPSMTFKPVEATNASPQAQPTFCFSGTGSKPANNMFEAPASAVATTSLTFGTPQQSTLTMATLFQKPGEPSGSIFQSSNPPSSSAPLFQKSESMPVATTASVSSSTTKMFSFGANATNAASMSKPEKSGFNFTFGGNKSETPALFKGASTEISNTNNFATPTGNAFGSNGMANTALSGGLTTGNLTAVSMSATSIGGTDMNTVPSGTTLPTPASNIFGTPVQKDNMWSTPNNNASNLFASTSNTNSIQKPAFTFGSSTPFNSNNAPPAFGSTQQSTPAFGSTPQSSPAFGSAPQSTPAFGSTAQAAPVFGIPNQNNHNQSLFSSPVQSQAQPHIFGSPQPASNPAPALPMFGSPTVGATPSFGATHPSFETPAMNPTAAPAFNFSGTPSTGVFGFGQQQQPTQQQGVYSFGQASAGAGAAPAGSMQFSMGSAPNAPGTANIAGRRMRKATRRNLR